MEIEKIVLENLKQITTNTANIEMLVKVFYGVAMAIIVQVIIFIKSLIETKNMNGYNKREKK